MSDPTDDAFEAIIWRHHAEFHRPIFYRYRVADDVAGYRLICNVYPSASAKPVNSGTRGSTWIGLALVVGRYAYCTKWAHARLRSETTPQHKEAGL